MATPTPVFGQFGLGQGTVGFNATESTPTAHALSLIKGGETTIWNDGAVGLAISFSKTDTPATILVAPWIVIPPGESLTIDTSEWPQDMTTEVPGLGTLATAWIGATATGTALVSINGPKPEALI